MSFAKKLLFGFLGMMAIATFIGARGLYAVNELNGKIAETIEYEMQAADYFAEFGVTFKAIDSIQRTLLNSNLAMDEREKQYAEYDENVKILDGIMENLKNILEKGSSTVDGWDNVLAEWRKTNSVLRKWEENNAILIKMHREWEKTTILKPDDLLWRLQQYRADHYGLVARLGGMLTNGKSSGPDISTDDTLCNFGKARVNFENGSVPYSFNPALMKAMRMIGGPHKEFHQTAHDLQELIKGGYDRNQAAIIAMFGKLIDLANQVIAEFDTMAAEAERSRELYEALYQKATMEFLPVQTDAMTKLIAVVDLNSKNAKENSDRAVADGENASKIMTWLVGASIVFGAILVLLLQRTVRHGVAMPLDRAVKGLFGSASKVAAAAVGLSQTSVSLSEGAQNQAASLEEISAALEEISSMTRKNADSTNEADSLMSDTASLITEGAREMGRMSTAMGEIRDSSNKINQILGVIEGIAFQTNLLALNAAVEAARAGEAGKGFAVVADEVRNLAQRSAQAAKDTATLITGTVDRVQNGVTITNDIGERFTKIKESTEKIVRMLGEIKTATNEQALGIDQVNTSVAQIDKVTQDNTANAEKSASESHGLSESSDHTMQTVGELSDTLDAIMGRKPGSSRAEASRHAARPARKKGGGRALPIASISRPTVMRPEDIVPLDECDDF